jgi:hypothetical protein
MTGGRAAGASVAFQIISIAHLDEAKQLLNMGGRYTYLLNANAP